MIRGRQLLRSLGPFWADQSLAGVWGVEALARADGKHYVVMIEETSSTDTDREIAVAIADALNSACGFEKGARTK